MTPAAAEPPFSSIGIVGLGLIGASVALAVRRTWPEVSLVACERPASIDDDARRLVDRLSSEFADVASAEIVILALPVTSIIGALGAMSAVGERTVVTDVGSTKRGIMAAAATHRVRNFIGGHPMAGSEQGGRAHAQADLFDGRPWLLVRGSADDSAGTRLERFVTGLGARPLWIEAAEHDRAIAYVSHAPQVLSVALMNAAAEGIGSGLRTAGRAFSEMTRLASSPPELWEDILATNADFVEEAVTEVARRLPGRSDLEARTWVRDFFAKAARARRNELSHLTEAPGTRLRGK